MGKEPLDEDVEWMTLPMPFDKPREDRPPALPATSRRDPLEPSSAGARPNLLQEALLAALSRARSACETLLTRRIDRLVRRDGPAARLWLTSQTASAYTAVQARWKSLARGDRALPSSLPGEAPPRRAAFSERSAPAQPQPAIGSKVGPRVPVEKLTASVVVYRPRRSAEDGLPILRPESLADDGLPTLELEPLDERGGTHSLGAASSRSSSDDAPEIILEPLDDEARTGLPSRLSNRGDMASARVEGVTPGKKRLVVISGLLAAGLLAALASETWLRKPAPSGGMAVSTNDRLGWSPAEAERQRQALQAAVARLPHLAPETIRLVLSRSPTGVLDPEALFQITYDAADRGTWALDAQEEQELRALRRELLDALLPWEAERVLEYDAARARRATFPFEDRAALDLFARGVRALPSRSRARLQSLFGKAIAAQLRADGASRL